MSDFTLITSLFMRDERYYELAEKWLNGTITPEERKEFSDWYNAGQDAPLNVSSQFAINEDVLRQRILDKIHTRMNKKAKRIRLWNNPVTRIAAASVVAISLGTGIYYLIHHSRQVSPPAVPLARTENPVIKPGGNKAILTLANGSSVVLDTASKGMILKEQGSRVIKMDDGRLAYETAKELPDTASTVSYNTLSTPKGGKYNIVLEDGTKIWLNAASSLRYPTVFRGKERLVELQGEGYFEVAKNAAMPFIVHTGSGSEVKVLGTHFNINAYDDEPAVKTTLLEGSVKFVSRFRLSREQIGNKQSAVLLPGQQAVLTHDSRLTIHDDADMDEAIAWKNDLFLFGQADMKSIMRQLARWYNVDVFFEQDIPGHFSATISRNEELKKVLHMLELTGAVHFTLKGQQVLVHR